jgi:cytochrome c
MKKVVLTCVMAFGLSLVSNVQADDVVALAKSKNCLSCHAVDRKLVGPCVQGNRQGKRS